MSKVGQPAQPPKLPAPEARTPHHPSPTSDTTKVGSVSPERIDQLDSPANRASHAKAPATAPSQALAPATQARPADQVQRVKPPSLPEVQAQTLRNFEERGIQEADKPFMTAKKALGLGALSVAAAFLLGPLGLLLPLAVVGVDYAAHRGLFHRALDLVFEGLNGRPFSGPSRTTEAALIAMGDREAYPLDDVYPGLKTSIKTVSLCDVPTPVRALSSMEAALTDGLSETSKVKLFVKDDGASNSGIYGGNKARKLELLLAQAHHRGDKEMVVSGTAGSHSVLASVLHAREQGLVPSVHLTSQIPSPRVADNLVKLARIMSQPIERSDGTETMGRIEYHGGQLGAGLGMGSDILRGIRENGQRPFICPPGATSTLSTVGYLNAMHELADDVRSGRLPEVPKKIFVPAGSGGTFIGLLLGTMTIPMFADTEIVAISSGSGRPDFQPKKHFDDVVEFLVEQSGGSFPKVSISEEELGSLIDRTWSGGAYGKRTAESTEAEALAAQDGLILESTYSAKAMAKMVYEARRENALGDGEDPSTWLFWNTNATKSPDGPPELNVSHPYSTEDLDLVRRMLGDDVMATYFDNHA